MVYYFSFSSLPFLIFFFFSLSVSSGIPFQPSRSLSPLITFLSLSLSLSLSLCVCVCVCLSPLCLFIRILHPFPRDAIHPLHLALLALPLLCALLSLFFFSPLSLLSIVLCTVRVSLLSISSGSAGCSSPNQFTPFRSDLFAALCGCVLYFYRISPSLIFFFFLLPCSLFFHSS